MTGLETMQMPALGGEGDACAECGAELAADQRYCLNCGRRRAGPRVPYQQHLSAADEQPTGDGNSGRSEEADLPPREITPLMTATALAGLGVMLLIGVLIGRGDSPEQAAAPPPAVVTVGETGASGGEETVADNSASKGAAKKGAKKAAKDSGPIGREVDSLAGAAKSGETVTASKEALEELDAATGKDYQDSIEKLPDKIATPGELPEQDPGGQAGAGSGAAVIK